MTCPECESTGSEQEYAAFHRDLCVLLQLDPERATADDVLRLVGEVVDRATEAERVAERLERMR